MNQDINMDEAQVGRILHFVISDSQGRSQCRPAIVVNDWPAQGKPGYVNIVVFTDGSNDGKYGTDDHVHNGLNKADPANLTLSNRWETSVLPNHAVRAIRSWHWPRECKALAQPASPFVNSAKERYHHNHADGMVDTHNCSACHMEHESLKGIHSSHA
jgi:hypothetical protein